MSEINDGIQIILNRMETNPQEFFGDSTRWQWIFKETMREVMTEQEKAAIHAGMVKVRRLEITAKAAATVLRADEMDERGPVVESQVMTSYVGGGTASLSTLSKSTGTLAPPKKRSLKDLL